MNVSDVLQFAALEVVVRRIVGCSSLIWGFVVRRYGGVHFVELQACSSPTCGQ